MIFTPFCVNEFSIKWKFGQEFTTLSFKNGIPFYRGSSPHIEISLLDRSIRRFSLAFISSSSKLTKRYLENGFTFSKLIAILLKATVAEMHRLTEIRIVIQINKIDTFGSRKNRVLKVQKSIQNPTLNWFNLVKILLMNSWPAVQHHVIEDLLVIWNSFDQSFVRVSDFFYCLPAAKFISRSPVPASIWAWAPLNKFTKEPLQFWNFETIMQAMIVCRRLRREDKAKSWALPPSKLKSHDQ